MARPVGIPTWIDYNANGLEASITFYERLAGWRIQEPDERCGYYRIATAADGDVAGLMDTTGMTCPAGEPMDPTWDVYLAVGSVEETVATARAAGAQVIVEPDEVPGRGRFAVLLDPAGASVGVWEDRGFAGFPDSTAPGHPVWFELMSMDTEASRRFYTEVFGFDYRAQAEEPGDDGPGYWTNGPGASATSGLCEANQWFPDGTRSFWRWYLAIDSTDDALSIVRELGGRVLDGPVDSPFGRVTTIQDPVGATLQLLEAPREGSAPAQGGAA